MPRTDPCGWKTLLLLSLLLGVAAFLTWPQTLAKEEPATDMASVATPSLRQLPQARQFMQPLRARQSVPPVSASTSPTEPELSMYPGTEVEPSSVSKDEGRRGMFARALSALALAGAANEQPASAKEVEGRPLLLLTPLAAAVGWVGFNILGPAGDQFGLMKERADTLEGKPQKRR